jgi:tellurite resistance protein TehA-like permease
MVRTIGRRVRFFAGLAIVGLVMVPLTPSDFRDTAWFVVGLAAFWAILFAIEDLMTPTYQRGDGRDRFPTDDPPPA